MKIIKTKTYFNSALKVILAQHYAVHYSVQGKRKISLLFPT
jgi:hypothetical protein